MNLRTGNEADAPRHGGSFVAPSDAHKASGASILHGAGAQSAPEAPRKKYEYVDQTPRRPRRSPLEQQAEAELGHVFVTMMSVDKPTPRWFGDNHGMLPIWTEVNADWRQAGCAFHRQQPAMRAIRLSVLGCPSDEHGKRLKKALDEALGIRETSAESDPLQHAARFKNGIDFGDIETWWAPLLQDALMTCELAARGFEVFGRDEHEARVAARVRLMVERARAGRGR